jgi:CheY-like chemotaxis protein
MAIAEARMSPHSIDKAPRNADEAGRESTRRSRRDRLRILVVDDDVIALEVARERLERLGLEVATRHQSLGTSRWILENKPDLVLLDLNMPALTGAELARIVKRHLTNGVIVHSSQSPEDLERVAREVGAIGGISKQLDDQDFAREMTRLIRLSRAELERAP